jgi:hypothetical protein
MFIVANHMPILHAYANFNCAGTFIDNISGNPSIFFRESFPIEETTITPDSEGRSTSAPVPDIFCATALALKLPVNMTTTDLFSGKASAVFIHARNVPSSFDLIGCIVSPLKNAFFLHKQIKPVKFTTRNGDCSI